MGLISRVSSRTYRRKLYIKMPVYKVQVKWGKEKFNDLELDSDEPGEVFRAQLYALSGVPPERQKIMAKGKTLKESWDAPWQKVLKDGLMLMMMGSADPLFKPPEQKTVFLEDMTDGEQNKALKIPIGLDNLGNTCYMNSTIQTMRACPDLVKALKNYGVGNRRNDNDVESHAITDNLKQLINSLENSSSDSLPPFLFLTNLHKYYPQFAERDMQTQSLMQHDANECWALLMRNMQSILKPSESSSSHNNAIDQLFNIEFTSKLKCAEPDNQEPESYVTENELQLSCFLDKDVKYLMSGIKNKLKGQLEKRAETLDRNAIFDKTTEISRLPKYLTVQMVRFFYKESRTTGASGTNAKILKDVKFPPVLDLYDCCAEDLQKKMQNGRNRFEVYNNWSKDQRDKKKLGDKSEEEKTTFLEANSASGDNESGYYELYGVLTHKVRKSTSGHYVAWTRPDPTKDEWFSFDDSNVAPVSQENVLNLSGGGDWHMSYVLLYGPRRIHANHVSMPIEEINEQIASVTGNTAKKSSGEQMEQ